MHDITTNNLRSAYGGESMAHMRYKIWSDKAKIDGFPNVARLFKAISYAETIHATNYFITLSNEAGSSSVYSMGGFGYSSTSDNLKVAVAGELFEINEMYPTFLNTAQFQQEKKAELNFHYALSAEKVHAQMFSRAIEAVDLGKDMQLGTVCICNNCGYTVEGNAPGICPICNVGKERFVSFT